jgi:hypothetical protein
VAAEDAAVVDQFAFWYWFGYPSPGRLQLYDSIRRHPHESEHATIDKMGKGSANHQICARIGKMHDFYAFVCHFFPPNR